MKILLLILTAVSLSFAKGPQPKKTTTAAPAKTQAPAVQQQESEPVAAPRYAAKKAYQRPYGMAGCGLGSIVIPRSGAQIFAATTNGTSFNQMFGITAGTSNCVDDSSSQVASKMDKYIHGNKAQFEGDVAKGNGETIVALSQVMGCSESVQLGKTLKANYQNIFSEVNTNIVTDNIITVIQNDDQLSQQCKLTI